MNDLPAFRTVFRPSSKPIERESDITYTSTRSYLLDTPKVSVSCIKSSDCLNQNVVLVFRTFPPQTSCIPNFFDLHNQVISGQEFGSIQAELVEFISPFYCFRELPILFTDGADVS